MNVSHRWLLDLAPSIEGSPREVADRLASLGAPVDEIVDLGGAIGDVVVARVREVSAHPDADRLRLCAVDYGGDEAVQVVCGAPNVEAGRFYPFAPVGAELPGGFRIKKAKLRGEASHGMLCSARELGLGTDHAGLMTLHGEWEPGTPFVDALALDDARLVVDVTPNRPELLSHVGVARELAPGGVDDVRFPAFPGASDLTLNVSVAERDGEADGVRIRIDDPEGCPRYLGAVVRGVRVGPSPAWLSSRLRAVGLRPINNVVDATNYVLLETGQPLHAFDLAELRGPEIVVRHAEPGETLTTLDGVPRTLEPGDLMIADAERSVALAGVMGGENSEVGEGTTDVLVECALFDARTVRSTARRLGLSTDASHRFERGVDPQGQPAALRRVLELIVAVAGGEVTGAVDVQPAPWTRPVVDLRPSRVAQVLGVEVPADEIASLLGPIGFGVEAASGGDGALRVTVPGWRPDVAQEIDLVEEVARRRGYDSFDEELLPFRPTAVPEDPAVAVERRLHELFVRRGFLEARPAAFAPSEGEGPELLNPLSAEEGRLRTSLAPGLLRRVEHNFAHGVRDVRLFQVGTVFHPSADGGVPHEELRVAAAFTGARAPRHWSAAPDAYDVWDLKGLLEALAGEYEAGAVEPGEYDPVALVTAAGTRLRLAEGEETVGGGGRAAEAALDAPAWAGDVWLLEARLPAAARRRDAAYADLPDQPASERDLALVVPVDLPAAEVGGTMREAAGALLEELSLLDLYAGEGLPEGTRSLAWRLRFRAPDRTLTDEEVEASVGRVLRALEERHGVRRR